MHIHLIWDASAAKMPAAMRATIRYAARFYDAWFTNPITVNGSLIVLGGNINITATSTPSLSTAASLQLGSGTAGTGQVLTGGTVSINSPVNYSRK